MARSFWDILGSLGKNTEPENCEAKARMRSAKLRMHQVKGRNIRFRFGGEEFSVRVPHHWDAMIDRTTKKLNVSMSKLCATALRECEWVDEQKNFSEHMRVALLAYISRHSATLASLGLPKRKGD